MDIEVADGALDTALAVGTLVALVHCRLDIDGTVAFEDSVRSAHCGHSSEVVSVTFLDEAHAA